MTSVRMLVLLFLLPLLAHADSIPGRPESPEYLQAKALVTQLGHPRYVKREEAGVALTRMGLAALPAVQEGTTAADVEIAARCVKLQPAIRAAVWDQRATLYVRDTAKQLTHDLPFQAAFEKMMSKELPASERAFFALLLRTNGERLQAMLDQPTLREHLLTERAQELLAWHELNPEENHLELGDICTLLFLSGVLPELQRLPHPTILLENPTITNTLAAKQHGPALRRLVLHWFHTRAKNDTQAYVQFTRLAVQTPFPEAAPLLAKLAQDATLCALTVRVPALQALARLERDLAEPTLLALLHDETVVGGSVGIGPKRLLGDNALAALLTLHKEALDTYPFSVDEFTILAGDTRREWSQTLYGFDTDAERANAKQRWQKKQQKK